MGSSTARGRRREKEKREKGRGKRESCEASFRASRASFTAPRRRSAKFGRHPGSRPPAPRATTSRQLADANKCAKCARRPSRRARTLTTPAERDRNGRPASFSDLVARALLTRWAATRRSTGVPRPDLCARPLFAGVRQAPARPEILTLVPHSARTTPCQRSARSALSSACATRPRRFMSRRAAGAAFLSRFAVALGARCAEERGLKRSQLIRGGGSAYSLHTATDRSSAGAESVPPPHAVTAGAQKCPGPASRRRNRQERGGATVVARQRLGVAVAMPSASCGASRGRRGGRAHARGGCGKAEPWVEC
jgi:hypothetical protein